MTRRLSIGGRERKDGWELYDIQPGEYVDHVGDARHLVFNSETFDELYCSHVLEHLQTSPSAALTEWCRVLKPGGKLYVSVPDMEYLCQLFVSTKDMNDKVKILSIIYGGHVDQYDYHIYGYDKDLLTHVLQSSGFERIESCEDFGLYKDCSTIKVNDRIISVNLVAYKGADYEVIPLESSL